MYPITNPFNVHGGITVCKALWKACFNPLPILPASDSPSRTNVLSPPALLLHSSSIAQLSGAGWPEKTQGRCLEVGSQAWGLSKALLAGPQLSTLNLPGSMMASHFLLCSFRVLQPQLEYLPPTALLPCPSDFSLAVTHWSPPWLRCLYHGLF